MALTTTAWNSSDYMKSEADIAAYVAICFEEAGDDVEFLAHVLALVAGGTTQLRPVS